MASFMERLAIIITADGKGAIREIEKVGTTAEREMGRAKTSADKWGATFVRTGALMVGASAVMGAGLFKAAQAFDEAHQAELRLQNSLANNPRLAGESASGYLKLANAIQQKTAADGDDVVAGMAALAQFRVTGSEIKQLTPLVVDLARKTGMDLVTANKLVGKALDGNAGALKRQGISVDENVYKTDRYKAVMDALRGTVGGFAEREGQTFSGQLARLKNNLRDVEEAIGGGVVKVLNELFPVINKATGAFKGLNEVSGGSLGTFMTIGTMAVGALGGFLLLTGGVIKLRTALQNLQEQSKLVNGAMNLIGGLAPVIGIMGGAALAGITLANVLGQDARALEVNAQAFMRLSEAQMRYAAQQLLSAGNLVNFEEVVRRIAQTSTSTAQALVDAADLPAAARRKLVQVIKDEEAANQRAEATSRRDADAKSNEAKKTWDLATAIEAVQNALLKAAGGELGYQQSLLSVQSAQNDLNTAIREHGVDSDEARAAELRLKQAQLELANATINLSASHGDLEKQFGGNINAAKEELQRLKDLQTQYPLSAGALQPLIDRIQTYIDTTNSTPTDKTTTFHADTWGATYAVETYRNLLTSLPGTVTTQVNAITTSGFFGTGAEGAIVSQPTIALIGEAGPEALVPLHKMPGAAPVPDMSSMAASAQMYGGVAKIVVPVVLDGRVVTEVVVSNLNRAGGPKISQKAVA